MSPRGLAVVLALVASCAGSPATDPSHARPPEPDALSTSVPVAASQRLALVHVTVIDVVRGIAVPDRAVLIEGDRIASVVPSAELAPDPRTTVVEGRGKYVIPGLWDMHVHFAEPAWAKLFVANGVTGVRVMWGNWHLARGPAARQHDAPDALGDRLHFEMRDAFEVGRAVGPHMVIGSDILDGPKPAWPHSVAVSNAADGRAAVVAANRAGADFIKVYSRLPREGYLAIAEESRREGLPFVGHVPDSIGIDEASDAGQKSIEHLDGVFTACSPRATELAQKQAAFAKEPHSSAEFWRFRTEQTLAAATSFDAARSEQLFHKLVANGTWQCPTLTVSRAAAWYREPAKLGIEDRMAYVPEPLKRYWDPATYPIAKDRTAADYAALREVFDRRLAVVGAMNRAHVPLLAGTDETNPFCFAGFGLHDELGLLVRAGLTPAEALRTATSNVAKFFGREDHEGAVANGMRADLVVLDANPLLDIESTRRIHAVILRGRLFDRVALDQLLAEVKADAARR